MFQAGLDTALERQLYTQASQACAHLSDLAFQHDRYSESLDHLEQAVAIAHRVGDRPHEWFALSEMTYALTMVGRWDEAFVRLSEIPNELFGKETNILSPLSGPLEIHLRRGQLDQARQMLSRYEEISRSGDAQAGGAYHAALAAVRLAEGNNEAALAAAEQAFATREALGIASQNVKIGYIHALEAARGLGDEAKMRQLLAIIETLPAGLRAPLNEATVHRFHAHLAGDDPGADRHFTAAEAQLRAVELPFDLAVVQLEHSEWLTARGRPGDAQPLLSEARDMFERLQAQPWLDRADALAPGATAEVPA